MTEYNKVSYDLKVNRYFSEILSNKDICNKLGIVKDKTSWLPPQIQKRASKEMIELTHYHFDLQGKTIENMWHLLEIEGGKGDGKSFLVMVCGILYVLNSGGVCGYLRNSVEEIKQIKNTLGFLIATYTPFDDTIVSDNSISDRKSKRILVNFLTNKNYNKISGNMIPYDFLFFDEFNQNLTGSMKILGTNFLGILQSLFRNNTWRIAACGNTTTKNNILNNIFKVNSTDLEPNKTVQIEQFEDNWITIIRYDISLFKTKNMDAADLAMIKKINPVYYKEQIAGEDYNTNDLLVINDFEKYKHEFTKSSDAFILDNRLYQLWKKQEMYVIELTDIRLDLNVINNMIRQGYHFYDFSTEYRTITSNVKDFYTSRIAQKIKKYMLKENVYFTDYTIYLLLKDNIDYAQDESFENIANN